MPALRVQIAQVREERAGNTDDDVLRYVGAWLLDRVEGEDSEKEDIMKYMDFSWVSRKAAASFKYGAKRLKMVVKHPEPATVQIYTIVPAFGWKKKDDIALQTLTLGKSVEGEDYAFGGKVKTKVTKKENKDLLFHTEFILSKKKKEMEWTWKVGPGEGEISVETRFGNGLNRPEAPMTQIYKRDPEVGADWQPTSKVRMIQTLD